MQRLLFILIKEVNVYLLQGQLTKTTSEAQFFNLLLIEIPESLHQLTEGI